MLARGGVQGDWTGVVLAGYPPGMSTTKTAPAKPSFTPPPPSPEHQATQKVADRFFELCNAGKNEQAIKDLYADNARHIEAMEGPGCPRITEGKKNNL